MNGDRDRSLLADMLPYAKDALELLGAATAVDLANDKMRPYAVVRAVEIVGEAASQVSPDGRAAFPTIPWTAAIRTRNRLIHGYQGLNEEVMVATVRDDFPPLIRLLEELLGNSSP